MYRGIFRLQISTLPLDRIHVDCHQSKALDFCAELFRIEDKSVCCFDKKKMI